MRAIVALFCRVGVRVDVKRVIRACLHARLAADAPAPVEIDYPVLAAEKRSHGADSYTGGVIAMIASEHRKESPGRRVFALLYVFDPGAKRPDGDIVFGFAGESAGMTADAFAVVYNEPISHMCRKPEVRYLWRRFLFISIGNNREVMRNILTSDFWLLITTVGAAREC
jgi:hypothetical protein